MFCWVALQAHLHEIINEKNIALQQLLQHVFVVSVTTEFHQHAVARRPGVASASRLGGHKNNNTDHSPS